MALDDLAERRVGEMSGGSRRRIDLAASLVGSPSVLFLDEPTTGLDPTARAALWDVVDELTASGTTVVLTTQYLDEADRLADQIVVLDHGRIAAPWNAGRAQAARRRQGRHGDHPGVAAQPVVAPPRHANGWWATTTSTSRSRSPTPAPPRDVVTDLTRMQVDFGDLDITSPSLDDVFAHLTLTGARS